jgi:hypothetical protein
MQRSLTPIIAGLVAVGAIIYAAPKPASARTVPTVHYGQTDAGMVQEVGRRYYRGRRYVKPYAYRYRPYGYGYYGRPYGYGYYGRPYYRPYAYYGGYGYPYGWRRPGISFGFGF